MADFSPPPNKEKSAVYTYMVSANIFTVFIIDYSFQKINIFLNNILVNCVYIMNTSYA